MTRYADYVPLFTSAGKATLPQCTSCGEYVKGGRLDDHVLNVHSAMDSIGFMVKVNEQWWRKRGT